MKRNFLFFLTLMVSIAGVGQLDIGGGVTGGYNFGSTFGAVKDAYNEANKDDLSNNLGGMSLYKGINLELNYRVMGLSCGLTRTYVQSGTGAEFRNGSKRMIDHNLKFTNVFLGGAFNVGERSEIRIEVGMLHSVSNIYSKVKLPTKEFDYSAGGASHQSTWTNVGLSGRIVFIQRLGDRFFAFGNAVFDRSMSDNTEIAPALKYANKEFTHTYQGVMINVGIGVKCLDLIQ